jgi:hypothetical protein
MMIVGTRSPAFMVCDNPTRNFQLSLGEITRSWFDEEERLFWDCVIEFFDVV